MSWRSESTEERGWRFARIGNHEEKKAVRRRRRRSGTIVERSCTVGSVSSIVTATASLGTNGEYMPMNDVRHPTITFAAKS